VPPVGGLLVYSPWFAENNLPSGPSIALSVNGNWKLDMDLLDFELARRYYVGTKLTFRPFIGARAAWIDQKMTVTANDVFSAGVSVGNRQVRISSDSWALGARLGIDTNWLFGCGFRTFGNAAAAFLYTDYKVKKNEDAIEPSVVNNTIAVDLSSKFEYLRTHLDVALGFGWGTYFSNKKYHFDFALSYDFNMFYHQNMIRYITETSKSGLTETPPANLYAHGLTIKAQFDF